jgi:hypothetical protein
MPNPNLDPDAGEGMRTPDRNRDPGADPDGQGVPEVADDATPGAGEIPEPEVIAVPTEQPVASTSYGTTALEQAAGEPLETRLAHEEPDHPERGDSRNVRPAEEAAMHVEEPREQ